MSKIEYERTIEIKYEHAEEKNHYLGYENLRRRKNYKKEA